MLLETIKSKDFLCMFNTLNYCVSCQKLHKWKITDT